MNQFMNSILTTPLQLTTLITLLATAMILGVLTALVFMFRCQHTTSYGIALALLPMVVCLVIMLVNGNIGAGIAVAGSFALVRFRSVPGTAREIAAVFTAVAIGLSLGMGYIGVAVVFFIFAAVFVLVLTLLNFGGDSRPEKVLKITIPEDFDYNGLFDDLLNEYTISYRLKKIRTTNMGTMFELQYIVCFKELQIKKEFFDEIRTRNGNLNVIVDDVMEKESL